MNFIKLTRPIFVFRKPLSSIPNISFHSSQKSFNSIQNDRIWKELSIEAIKDELQQTIKEYGQISNQNCLLSKNNIVTFLVKSKEHIESNKEQIQTNYSFLKMSSKTLLQQIQLITKIIDEYKYTSHLFPVFTLFYNEINQHINQNHQDRFALIIQILVKLQYSFDFLNNLHHQPHIFNSHPSQFEEVWKKIKIIPMNQQKTIKDYNRLDKMMKVSIGILCQFNNLKQTNALSLLKTPFAIAGGAFRYKRKILQSLYFFKNPSIKVIQTINNIQKTKAKQIIQLTFPKIKSIMNIYIPSRGEFQDNLDIFKEDANAIPVKILYNKQIPIHSSIGEQIEQAFYHIHGGGFVLFSSFVAQNQTRFWAKQSNKLIFSIDYKLAPKHPFPQAVYDCLQVYRFLTQQIHKYFKIKLKRVFIGGDSAGGSLSCGLTSLIMRQQLKMPSGLFLMYPSLDLRKIYYPSRKYTLSDFIISPSFVQLCTQSYLRTDNDSNHPLASPILITEQFVGGTKGDHSFPRKWPKTYIVVGEKDPLRDENLHFMQRMVQSGVDCECRVYQGFRHGFMNTEHFIRQSEVPWMHSLQIIKELFSNKKGEQLK